MPLEIGDLILVSGKSAVDRAIEWAEDGEYSHVAIYAGNGKVLEAQGNRRVGYNDLSAYKGIYDIGRVRRATTVQRALTLRYARAQIGKRYAWRAILVLALNLLFHLKIPYKQDFKKFICSFYAEDAWESGGLPLTNVNNPTPQDLANSPEVVIQKGT